MNDLVDEIVTQYRKQGPSEIREPLKELKQQLENKEDKFSSKKLISKVLELELSTSKDQTRVSSLINELDRVKFFLK